ncbi:MAG: sigma-54-dependent Fis family transcriptional regulator [Planctomycetes bacterium]|nr:sigma-54-dependent Fis family transcriptional regulator [Planctomycetota bacterium]
MSATSSIRRASPAGEFQRIWSEGGQGPYGRMGRLLAHLSLLASPSPIARTGCDAAAARLWDDLLDEIAETARAERAYLIAIDEGKPAVRAARTLDREPLPNPEGKVPSSIVRRAVETKIPFLGLDLDVVDEDARDLLREAGLQAAVALPLIVGGHLAGLICFENRFRGFELTRDGMEWIVLLARAGSLALTSIAQGNESLHLAQEIRRLSGFLASGRHAPGDAKPAPTSGTGGGDYSEIVTKAPALLEIFETIDKLSHLNVTVLIQGESGTGKELVARAIHANSLRRDRPFVSENCGALTETLLESELFGYVRGAFTGATQDRKGLFEVADGGTLFLDEVGDMSPGMQKKLLRSIQEGVIRRVGGKDYIPVDVRIISATNKDLVQEVKERRFREDLFYRLNVITIRLPALRERREDIPLLVECFLERIARETGVRKGIDPEAMRILGRYAWPGNVRELQNEVRRLHTLSGPMIRADDLSEKLLSDGGPETEDISAGFDAMTLEEATGKLEHDLIRKALVRCRGNKSRVAKLLAVPKTSLYNKIHKYGLDDL